MIALLMIILAIILIFWSFVMIYKINTSSTKQYKHYDDTFNFGLTIACTSMFLVSLLSIVIYSVNEANEIYAKIKMMPPSDVELAKLRRTEKEFEVLSNTIQNVFDKYKIQSSVVDLSGVKLFTAQFSTGLLNFEGLGDIERASGEKLKNLEFLIDKQWKLAEELIALEVRLHKPEFYELNQQLHVLKSSISVGLVVRMFLKDVDPVYNENYYINRTQISKD